MFSQFAISFQMSASGLKKEEINSQGKKQSRIHNNVCALNIVEKVEAKDKRKAELCCEMMMILKTREENLHFCSQQLMIMHQDGI